MTKKPPICFQYMELSVEMFNENDDLLFCSACPETSADAGLQDLKSHTLIPEAASERPIEVSSNSNMEIISLNRDLVNYVANPSTQPIATSEAPEIAMMTFDDLQEFDAVDAFLASFSNEQGSIEAKPVAMEEFTSKSLPPDDQINLVILKNGNYQTIQNTVSTFDEKTDLTKNAFSYVDLKNVQTFTDISQRSISDHLPEPTNMDLSVVSAPVENLQPVASPSNSFNLEIQPTGLKLGQADKEPEMAAEIEMKKSKVQAAKEPSLKRLVAKSPCAKGLIAKGPDAKGPGSGRCRNVVKPEDQRTSYVLLCRRGQTK